MFKRFATAVAVLLFVVGLVVAGQGKEGEWTGWITDTHCGAEGANAKHAGCAKKCVEGMGAKYALYTPSNKKVYTLEPQDRASGHAGHYVKVKGTVDGETIKVASIEMIPEPKGN